MWRSKKFIIIVLLATIVALAGTMGGIALAQENGDDSQPETIFDRVTAVLVDEGVNITAEQLKDAFAQVQGDIRTEAMEKFLDKLVEEEKITQGEADEYLQWWGERPDVPFGFGFEGGIGFRGMHRMRGFGGLCLPEINN